MRWVHVYNHVLCRWTWIKVPALVRVAAFSGIGLCSVAALPVFRPAPAPPPPIRAGVLKAEGRAFPPPWGAWAPSNDGADDAGPGAEAASRLTPLITSDDPADPSATSHDQPIIVLAHAGPDGGGQEPGAPGVTTTTTRTTAGAVAEPASAVTLGAGCSALAWARRRRRFAGVRRGR